MKNNMEYLQNEWVKNLANIHAVMEELEELEREKEKLLNLASSSNPPQNILQLLNESEQKYEALLKKSNKLNTISKELKNKIEGN